ncbi:uncharacterized protein LOC110621459 [Manihot esculenta]|uniref:uncharacterized protein LOC110621459 n=1 Tax=Manihot esculenta TaxID=3983 RepID=UPI000B5D689D|nr:uncharacterized protein LOC110621459 [Manihot esculenta]
MQGFRQAFEHSNLIQIPTVGSFFIWEKGRESNNLVREKLDRALATKDWARKFTNDVCLVVHVPRSDHKPLVINTAPKDNRRDRRRFRFDNAWSRNRDFWQKKKTMQRLLDNGPSTVSHASLKEDCNRLLEQEEVRLKQQAKCFWLNNGDRNTKFFHFILYGDSVDCERIFELVLPLISDADNADLCAPFSNEKFRVTLFQMHPDKAPGPDRLNPAFYQRFWHLIGNDVSDGCRLWLQQGTFPSSLTETLIILISKVDSPETVKDFRPITLCNVLYKIVAKALANRFKRVLPMTISKNQSAFIPHRLITDNIMVAFEMIHNMKTNKGRNDEGLSLLLKDAESRGRLQGCKASARCPKISHLFFADDSLLFFNARLEEADSIKSILNTYAAASGQVVNFNKSGIFFNPNVVSSVRSNISNILDVHSPLSHSAYLGLPSLIGRNKKAVFDFLKERMWKRINSWGSRFLSRTEWSMAFGRGVFKTKYFPNGDLFSTNVSNGASFIWKSVMAIRELIQRGTRWRVGNGENILMASAPWIPKEDIFFADDGFDFIEPHLRVCDPFEGNGRVWNITLLMELFSSRDIKPSISIPISIINKEDPFLWHFDKGGVYTVKSAYVVYMNLLGRSSFNVGDESWTSLWNVSIPPKVKDFCWRACRNILPTKDNLRQKSVDMDARCPWCHKDESVNHILLHCPVSKEILKSQDKIRKAFLMVCAWRLWSAKNSLLWNQVQNSAAHLVEDVMHHISDWEVAQHASALHRNTIATLYQGRNLFYFSNPARDLEVIPLQIRASSPSLDNFNWFCQIDGFLFQVQDFIGYGFVVKNFESIFQRGVCSFSEGNGTLIIVETLTLHHCLLFVTKFLSFNGCIFLDCLQVIFSFHI